MPETMQRFSVSFSDTRRLCISGNAKKEVIDEYNKKRQEEEGQKKEIFSKEERFTISGVSQVI